MKKRLGFRIVLVMMLLSIVVSFKYIDSREANTLPPAVINSDSTYPTISIKDGEGYYNVMYPNLQKMAMTTSNDAYTNFISGQKLDLFITEYEANIVMTYEIIMPQSYKKVIQKKDVREGDRSQYKDGALVTIKLPFLKQTELPYLLKLTYYKDNKALYYYQSFYINDLDRVSKVNQRALDFHRNTFEKKETSIINSFLVRRESNLGDLTYVNESSDIKKIMWKYNLDIIKMNEPNVKIKYIDNKEKKYELELSYTVAIRQDHEFEYWDYIENYILYDNGQDIMIETFDRYGTTKTESFYDKEKSAIKLGTGTDNKVKESQVSNNGLYLGYIKNNQLWLYDSITQSVIKVFGFDKLDSDYVIDSYKNHDMEIISISDNGDITYMVYGYMNSDYYSGYSGILINKFNYATVTNEDKTFISFPYDFETLSFYVDSFKYITDNEQYLYMLIKGVLYQFDLNNNIYHKILDDLPINYDNLFISSNKQLIAWQEEYESKYNSKFFMVDLERENIEKLTIKDKSLNVKILETTDHAVLIGYYDIKNTFEKLNGSVIYPYSKLGVIDPSGYVIQEYNPSENKYFSNIIVNKSEEILKLTPIEIAKSINSNPKKTKIYFEFDNEETHELSRNTTVDNKTIEEISVKEQDYETLYLQVHDSKNNNSEIRNIYFVESRYNYESNIIRFVGDNNKTFYESYQKGKLVANYDTASQALKDNNQVNYDYIIKVGNEDNRSILWSSEDDKEFTLISGIPVIPQKPDLPIGCEVTSLSMLLNYYLDKNIDKLQLAEEITMDETEYSVVDGMIYFGDMHSGFVGNMADISEPGIGVYHKPIAELMNNYMPNQVMNITGSDFEDVLYFVGQGKPVLVITPNIYNKVSDYSLQHWMTPNGMMEISYTEHSVLIIGYDKEYVYYNDPSKNILDKKRIKNFKAGWENFGRQAILAY